ncbi:MAG: hypothetical protein WAM39_04690, partial [Bryobacteraceae bacterium]
LVGGLVVFLPRPTVSAPSAPVNGVDQASVSFDISNNGLISLDDVGIAIGLGIATSGTKGKIIGTPDFKVVMRKTAWQHQHLGMDDRFTIVLSDIISGGVVSADIAVIVRYRPWVLPLRREKIYRFVTYPQINGENHWRSFPLDAPRPDNIK